MEQNLKLIGVMKCLRRAPKFIMGMILSQVLATPINTLAAIPPKQKTIDFYAVKEVRPNVEPLITQEDVFQHILPPISPTNDPKALVEQVKTGIPQKWTDELMRSSYFKKTPVGVATQKVEQTVKQSVTVTSPSIGVAPPITHTFNVDLKVWEHMAYLRYSGFFNSQFAYNHLLKTMQTSISKPLGTDTTLSLTNTSPFGKIERAGQVVLTYNF